MPKIIIFKEGEYTESLELEYTSIKAYNNVKLYLDGEKVVLVVEKVGYDKKMD